MMYSMEMYLSFGSNLGDRENNILKASEFICNELDVKMLRFSDIIETEPWGFECDQNFLNAVGVYEVAEDSYGYGLEVLSKIKDIERRMGRDEVLEFDSNGHRLYHSRTIDIDILLLGDLNCNADVLTVPHPLMFKRDFVMKPLAQVASEGILNK